MDKTCIARLRAVVEKMTGWIGYAYHAALGGKIVSPFYSYLSSAYQRLISGAAARAMRRCVMRCGPNLVASRLHNGPQAAGAHPRRLG